MTTRDEEQTLLRSAALQSANSILIALSSPHMPLERHIAVRLTPGMSERPWDIDYDVETPAARRSGDEPKPDALPVPAILSPIP